MKKNIIWITTLILAVVVGASSCGKRQHIELSKDTLAFSSMGGYDFFTITADCDWTIENDPTHDWYSISQTEGSKDTTVITINVSPNENHFDRSSMLKVISDNGRTVKKLSIVQANVEINKVIRKVWFTRLYERWNTDFHDQYIEESYRSWTFYAEPQYVNWFFYFLNDGTGYEIRTYNYDTIYYPYNYIYYPNGDSLFISFQLVDDTITEDYHATIYELNQDRFVFLNEYRPHQFEKINTVNVSTNSKSEIKINPKKVVSKPMGPLIQVKNDAR